MEAAHITWRPLGQLFVERGLITQDELEEALVEQEETRKRLGAILVSRGLVSGPELTSVLVDQLGMELTKESGFGSGLWDEIRRRHTRKADGNGQQAEARKLDAVTPTEQEPEPAPPPAQALDLDAFEEAIAALSAERAALEQALEEERTAKHQAVQDLMQARADTGSRASELEELARQVTELRRQVEESTVAVAAEQKAIERVKTLETKLAQDGKSAARIATLEAALAAEQAKRQEHADELDFARSEASVEAKELRASLESIRAQLEQLDAATCWFEYWSGAVDPTAKD